MAAPEWTQEELDYYVRADPCGECGEPGHNLEIVDIIHDCGYNDARVRCPECENEETRGLPPFDDF